MSLGSLKTAMRDAIPPARQVAVKYLVDFLRGTLEPELALLPALIGRGQRAIDVGGNRGTYAFRLARLGARIEVFEPNPVCLNVLKHWAQGRANIHVHAVALSNRSGVATLHIPIGAAGVEHDASASIEHSSPGAVRDEVVPLATLDSFGFADAALIKIDVEGHEHAVIEGATQTIAKARPALLVEIEQRHLQRPISDVFARITGLGLEGFYLKRDKLVPLGDFDVVRDQDSNKFGRGGTYFNNFLFLPVERLAAGEFVRLDRYRAR